MSGTVPFKVSAVDEGPVRLLTLERPEKLNAFTAEGYLVLTEQLAARGRRQRGGMRAHWLRSCVLGRRRPFGHGTTWRRG